MSQSLLQIGPYAIGRPASDYPDIRKLSWFNTFDIKRPKVRGVKRYKGSQLVDFLDRPREVILGIVQDSVWSLSVLFAFNSEDSMGVDLVKVVEHYRPHLGEYTSDTQYPIQWLSPSAHITINVQSVTGAGTPLYFFTLTISAN